MRLRLLFCDGIGGQCAALFDSVSAVLPLMHFADHGVRAVEPVGHDVGDEELAPVGAGSGIGHGERADLVLVRVPLKFIFEAISGTAAAGAGRVATLNHEVINYTVENGSI